jgi:hypothetical protein
MALTKITDLLGNPYSLGATRDGAGVNLSIFSGYARSIDLYWFDSPAAVPESARTRLSEETDLV